MSKRKLKSYSAGVSLYYDDGSSICFNLQPSFSKALGEYHDSTIASDSPTLSGFLTWVSEKHDNE